VLVITDLFVLQQISPNYLNIPVFRAIHLMLLPLKTSLASRYITVWYVCILTQADWVSLV